MRKQNFVDFSFADCYNEIRLSNVNFLVENPLPVSTGWAMGRKRRTDSPAFAGKFWRSRWVEKAIWEHPKTTGKSNNAAERQADDDRIGERYLGVPDAAGGGGVGCYLHSVALSFAGKRI